MLRKITLYCFLCCAVVLSAQTIEITSFEKSKGELEITYRKKHFPVADVMTDDNGNPCALIKIMRADEMSREMLKRIVAEGNGQFLRPKYVENEGLYFYVSYNMDLMKVYDKDNPLQQQSANFNLKKYFEYVPTTGSRGLNPNAVYNMAIKYTGGRKYSGKLCKVSITATPADATIFINDENLGVGKAEVRMQTDLITYRVERQGYYPQDTTIELTDNIALNVALKPICGTLHVESNPTRAQVLLNGQKCGFTPLDTTLQIGSYTVEIQKQNARLVRQTIHIEENKALRIAERLQISDVVNITSSPTNAKIYINGKEVGETPLTYEMYFGHNYLVEAEKFGGKRSEEVHFHENYKADITFEIDPKLNVSPSYYTFPVEGGSKTFNVYTPYDNWKLTTTADWLDVTKKATSFAVATGKNRRYDERKGTITLQAANKTENITITQSGKFRKQTEGFSDFFLEYVGGYMLKAKQPTVGLNFSYLGEGAGGHLGFYLNPNYALNNTFVGAAGLVTRWAHHQQAAEKYNNFDFQFYLGAAYKTDFATKGNITDDLGADIGFRLTGTDPEGSRFGFYSATIGAKVFRNEIIPSIGLSTGMFGSALIFRDGRINERASNYQQWYMEAIGAYGLNTDEPFWAAGGTLAFVPSSMGGYVTGMGINSRS